MNTTPSENIKTVLELDLASYSDIARALEENLDVHAVKAFEDQVQSFVDQGLTQVGLRREDVVLGSAGDNAILVFDDPAVMHRFGEAVQKSVAAHNQHKSVESAKRWFRMGAATGPILMLQAERRIVGTTVARAVRLEAAAKNGQILVDVTTYDSLPESLQASYGEEERIRGKRDELFIARRCTFVPTDEADQLKHVSAPSAASPPAPVSSWNFLKASPLLAGAVGLALAAILVVPLLNKLPHEKKEPPPPVAQAPAKAEPVDLLQLVDVKRDRRKGLWLKPKEGRLEGRPLPFDKQPNFALVLPWEPPLEYRLKLKVTRLSKEEGNLAVGLAGGTGRFFVSIDAMKGGKHFSAMHEAAKGGERSNIWVGRVLRPGIPVELVCTVQTRKITVEAGGRELFHWSGDVEDLSRPDEYGTDQLGLVGNLATVFAFDEIILEPLGPDAGKGRFEISQ